MDAPGAACITSMGLFRPISLEGARQCLRWRLRRPATTGLSRTPRYPRPVRFVEIREAPTKRSAERTDLNPCGGQPPFVYTAPGNARGYALELFTPLYDKTCLRFRILRKCERQQSVTFRSRVAMSRPFAVQPISRERRRLRRPARRILAPILSPLGGGFALSRPREQGSPPSKARRAVAHVSLTERVRVARLAASGAARWRGCGELGMSRDVRQEMRRCCVVGMVA